MIRKGEFEVKLKDGTRIAFPWYRVGFAENAYANLDCRNAGFETVPVAFNKRKDEGIENLARYFEHGKIKIADDGHLQIVVRQLLRFQRAPAAYRFAERPT